MQKSFNILVLVGGFGLLLGADGGWTNSPEDAAEQRRLDAEIAAAWAEDAEDAQKIQEAAHQRELLEAQIRAAKAERENARLKQQLEQLATLKAESDALLKRRDERRLSIEKMKRKLQVTLAKIQRSAQRAVTNTGKFIEESGQAASEWAQKGYESTKQALGKIKNPFK